ncbi:ead/Ea22-like family protein [Escherichia coli]
MSNINKQELREIAAAAVGAHERLSVMPPDDIFDISLAEGTQLDADITALNALNSAANPATVLALLASLEAAEKRIAELEAREIKPAKGEVLVVVSGFTGCGKSAIAGEIEIAMKAIGVPVQWTNGDAEKRMTGADWLTAIEMYKPTVRIVEVNVPRAAGIGKGE